MEIMYKKLWFFNLAVAVLLFFSADAYAEALGWLIDISATDRKITIDEVFPEKKHKTYIIADDAKWHICTEKACILKKGAAAYPAFKELAKKEAYGIPYSTFRVFLRFYGDKATALEIRIVELMH
ncbi:MAG: hypothetical protein IMF07_04625 [Proteobacteria bacterium]|nr:hypothetical protein [Pseudomonadota bacterium]